MDTHWPSQKKKKKKLNHLKFPFKILQCDSDSNSFGHISVNLSFVHELLYKWLYCSGQPKLID